MNIKHEIAIFLGLAPFMILAALTRAPDLVAYWPYPVAVSANTPTLFIAANQIPGGNDYAF